MKISQLKTNPHNPRVIKDDKFTKLVESIRNFPQMMALRPIIVDENNIIQGGNMRFKALQQLEYKDIPDAWVKQAKDLTKEQWAEFVIKDNVPFGEWDWDILANEWDANELENWGLNIPNFDSTSSEDEKEDKELETKLTVTCSTGREAADLFEEMLNRGFKCELKG